MADAGLVEKLAKILPALGEMSPNQLLIGSIAMFVLLVFAVLYRDKAPEGVLRVLWYTVAFLFAAAGIILTLKAGLAAFGGSSNELTVYGPPKDGGPAKEWCAQKKRPLVWDGKVLQLHPQEYWSMLGGTATWNKPKEVLKPGEQEVQKLAIEGAEQTFYVATRYCRERDHISAVSYTYEHYTIKEGACSGPVPWDTWVLPLGGKRVSGWADAGTGQSLFTSITCYGKK